MGVALHITRGHLVQKTGVFGGVCCVLQICLFPVGKLCEGMAVQEPEFLRLPGEEKVVDVQIACDYMLLLTGSGNLYSLGKNAPGTCLVSLELCVCVGGRGEW